MLCPSGQFSSGYGDTACVNCAVGSYSPSLNSSACTLCAPGYATPVHCERRDL